MATSRTVGSLNVTIVETCIDISDDKQIKIELDEDLNNEVTCFEPNSDIYLRFYLSPQDLDITAGITNGTLYATGRGGLSEHTEEIVITDGEASTTYPIEDVSSIEWIGNAPCAIGNVDWDVGRSFLACPTDGCVGSPDGEPSCEVTYGVIRIEYTARYIGYVANVPSAGTTVIHAYENLDDD
jgi:hypothetical protein